MNSFPNNQWWSSIPPNTTSNPPIGFEVYEEQIAYIHKLFSETNIHLSDSIISAMFESGIWYSFVMILENEKRKQDELLIAQMNAQLVHKCPYPTEGIYSNSNYYDDNNKETMKKQMISENVSAIQTDMALPIRIDLNLSWKTLFESNHT
ncbi:unnamed protein product [Adineta steineri]|uniref:Uncharacterized protein n=1 Tax=Adineta steineri TaxID=433720 RepID=A0A815TPK5_9BILA|nr:unnamed protein product [Adineta steineri]CAF3932223.1 unnamed protein product [Adineta steineri]